jgi:hypothetical protein
MLSQFIQALIFRYNMSGRRQIQYVEIWNEPHFLGNNKGFWWGAPAQLAALGRVVFQTAKSVDPGIRILSPAFDGLHSGHFSPNETGVNAGLRQYMQASDGAGATGAQWFDAVAIHTYNADIINPLNGLEGTIREVAETLEYFRLPIRIFCTETGYTETSKFQQSSLADKANLLRRQAAVQAAMGIQSVCFYSHDDQFCGNPSMNPPIAQVFNDMSKRLAGQVLQQVTVLSGGQVQVTTHTGSLTW